MFFLSIILGLLPSFAWLNFFLKEDTHPEPKKLILQTFLLGAFLTVPALIIQLSLKNSLAHYFFLSIFIFGGSEELINF